jgi:DNA-binding transcriptional MerR regulator
MSALEDRRYRISEVSDLTEVAVHVLRQWEARFPQLKPKRDRSNRRYYMPADIGIVRRIKELVRHEKLTTHGD